MRPFHVWDNVVYDQAIAVLADARLPWPDGLGWMPVGPADVPALYADRPDQAAGLQAFFAQGYLGVALHERGRWVAHIWTATPATRAPLHLPAALGGRYWLISGHTRPDWRGRGCLKLVIRQMARHLLAQGADPTAPLVADARTSNGTSRRSLEGLGFRPSGRLLSVRVAGAGWVVGRWDPAWPHPSMTA